MSRKLYLIPSLLSPDSYHVLGENIRNICNSLTHFLVEDVRTARRYLSGLKISTPIQDLHFYTLNKDTSLLELKEYFTQIPENQSIGVISDAGCPGVADPGAMAAAEAHRLNIDVIPLVGPSSILLALMGSGMSGQNFCFNGYLPVDAGQRVKKIRDFERESFEKQRTQIFIETPYRNNKLMEDFINNCKPDTELCIGADLTGEAAFLRTLKVKDWKGKIPDLNKIPAVFLLYASKG